jgi:hypothetical protein
MQMVERADLVGARIRVHIRVALQPDDKATRVERRGVARKAAVAEGRVPSAQTLRRSTLAAMVARDVPRSTASRTQVVAVDMAKRPEAAADPVAVALAHRGLEPERPERQTQAAAADREALVEQRLVRAARVSSWCSSRGSCNGTLR